MTPLRKRIHGLSLIEILIALAVFLIGILAVLRIFPTGLGTLVRQTDKQSAILLAESRMQELQDVQDRLPDMILPAGRPTDVTPGGGTPNTGFGFLRFLAGQEELRPYDYGRPYGDLTNTSEPNIDPAESQLLHRMIGNTRLVVGERVLLGARSEAPGSPGPTLLRPRAYHALFGPLQAAPGGPAGDLTVFREFAPVEPLELRVTRVTLAGGDVYRDRPVFAVVDGGSDPFTGAALPDKLLLELDSSPRQFAIRCAYRDATGLLKYVQLAPFYASSPTAAAADPQVSGAAVPATESYATVELRLPDVAETPITDVVEDSLLVRQALPRGVADDQPANRFNFDDQLYSHGVLRFSPLLAGEELALEYVVEDWRILREKVTLTDQVDTTGAPGADGLIDDHDNDASNGTCLQLTARNLDETFQPRVVMLADGTRIPLDTATWTANPDLAGNGLVPVNPTLAQPLTAPTDAWVFYRRINNWQVAPSVAPSSYLLAVDAPTMGGAGFPVLGLLVDTAPVTADPTRLELQFRPSEAGRVVAVTYEVGAAGARRLISGELHVVPTQANRRPAASVASWRHALVLREPNVAVDGTGRPLIHGIEGRNLAVRVGYDEDTSGQPVDAGAGTYTAQQLVEVSTYVRRQR
ncbi:MAG: prepilin-type N-terminal cleavage/methylation domain-containing protein [Fimbriimonadaceae bacterium]|nr:prepilin-type N-terminal cleavage/methylation domain-containing protein [Fimbriimonadaceae bacterium]